jgi:hypothetical protein
MVGAQWDRLGADEQGVDMLHMLLLPVGCQTITCHQARCVPRHCAARDCQSPLPCQQLASSPATCDTLLPCTRPKAPSPHTAAPRPHLRAVCVMRAALPLPLQCNKSDINAPPLLHAPHTCPAAAISATPAATPHTPTPDTCYRLLTPQTLVPHAGGTSHLLPNPAATPACASAPSPHRTAAP